MNKKILVILGLLLSGSFAQADISSSQYDALAFSAIAKAVVAKHKVQIDGGIKLIEKTENGFKLQLLKANGECQQIAVQLYVRPSSSETPEFEVDFPRLAPFPCK